VTDAILAPDPDPSPDLPLSDTIVAPQVPVTTDAVESTLLDFYSESLPEFMGFADVLSDLPPYLDFLHSTEPDALLTSMIDRGSGHTTLALPCLSGL